MEAKRGSHHCPLRFNTRLVSTALAVWAFASGPVAGQTAAEFQKRGLESIRQSQFDRAIVELSEAIRLDPNFATAFVERARAWASKEEYDKANADLDEAMRIEPRHAGPAQSGGQFTRREQTSTKPSLSSTRRSAWTLNV